MNEAFAGRGIHGVHRRSYHVVRYNSLTGWNFVGEEVLVNMDLQDSLDLRLRRELYQIAALRRLRPTQKTAHIPKLKLQIYHSLPPVLVYFSSLTVLCRLRAQGRPTLLSHLFTALIR
jgi:hypothetical protein